MFASFGGPLPLGNYIIRNTSDLKALHLPSIVNNTVLTMQTYEEKSLFQTWILEFGHKGYKIKSAANGSYLSYTPWGVPSSLIGTYNQITASAGSPVEWELVQISVGTAPRTFQLRIAAGNRLKPTDDIILSYNGYLYPALAAGLSGTTFSFSAVGTPGEPIASLTPVDRTRCVIRNVYYPHIALDLFNSGDSAGSLVVGGRVNGEDEQTWGVVKSGNNWKIKNSASEKFMGYAVVPNTPVATSGATLRSVVATDGCASTEFLVVQSSIGFELRPVADPTSVVTLYNLDAEDNGYVYLEQGSKSGSAFTNQQWVFVKPGTNIRGERGSHHAHTKPSAPIPSEGQGEEDKESQVAQPSV
ncbi:hypothetical protein FRB95_004918 [Tulasnella sp. JGI-2019a]|nr:hypothetical protein FRB93_005859 [Tulasnella sp. JGI-2019a]KAG9029766.1 hypothetical protein FRB95_004918 [Tulasnella sp. JGI-2019a]